MSLGGGGGMVHNPHPQGHKVKTVKQSVKYVFSSHFIYKKTDSQLHATVRKADNQQGPIA